MSTLPSTRECETHAAELEKSPDDLLLDLRFRQAVDAYGAALQQSNTTLDLDTPSGCAQDVAAAQCTVDLDLRFLGLAALTAQATRLHVTEDPGDDGLDKRVRLLRAIMRARAANTGYLASAPPSQSLEHFFDLTKRSGGLYGRLVRRMLWIDYAQRELALIYKEGETKAYAFSNVSRVEPVENGVRLTAAGGREVVVLCSTSAREVATLLHRLLRALPASGSASALSASPLSRLEAGERGSTGQEEGAATSGIVRDWRMSGTVEKEGKLRWASRWLVLSATRLYVLRFVTSLCPLNVIALGEDVRVIVASGSQSRVFTVVTRARSFNFKTSDERIAEQWVAAIGECCRAAGDGGATSGGGEAAGGTSGQEAGGANPPDVSTMASAEALRIRRAFETPPQSDEEDEADVVDIGDASSSAAGTGGAPSKATIGAMPNAAATAAATAASGGAAQLLKPKEIGVLAASLVASLAGRHSGAAATSVATTSSAERLADTGASGSELTTSAASYVPNLRELEEAMAAISVGLTLPRSLRPAEVAPTASVGAPMGAAAEASSAAPLLSVGKGVGGKQGSLAKPKSSGLTNRVRALVSLKKRRYIGEGFDLDLTYITPQIIAMGFPSEGAEGVYRNPMSEVVSFLETRHRDHYMVYNLCSERSYDPDKFGNRVKLFPFDDHNPPPLRMIPPLCVSVHEFLEEAEENVVVIHCKAGKGRTGTMICSYLLYAGEFDEPQAAMDFYGFMRTHNRKGVTIPSQIRYVGYAKDVFRLVQEHGRLPVATSFLRSVRLSSVPTFDSKGGCEPHLEVRGGFQGADIVLLSCRVSEGSKAAGAPLFDCGHLEVSGDFKVVVYDQEPSKKRAMFAFWLHTSCAGSTGDVPLRLAKSELDGAASDKKHKLFPEAFGVEISLCAKPPKAVAGLVAAQAELAGPEAADGADGDSDSDDDDAADDALPSAGRAAAEPPTSARRGGGSLLKSVVTLRPLRQLVSKKKRRYIGDGFDLDLTYITPRVIAMGFPSEGAEGVYRNPMSEVVSFLETRHRDHYMVYNLCSERSYDATKFGRRVQLFPFDDHNPPPLRMIYDFCTNVKEFLQLDPSNIVAVHCKAGKGRTGVMISAFLLHDRFFTQADDALAFYGYSRANDCEGVTIPSQRTYVHYYEQICRAPSLLDALTDRSHTLTLRRVTLVNVPSAIAADAARSDRSHLVLRVRTRTGERAWSTKMVEMSDAPTHGLELTEEECTGPRAPLRSTYESQRPFVITNSNGEEVGRRAAVPVADFIETCPLPICGDVRIEVASREEPLFHFWFHASMIGSGDRLVRRKWLLDGLKDPKHKKFDAHFRVDLSFLRAPPKLPSSASTPVAAEL